MGVLGGDMLRKSIVFDMKTPDLFYCPVQKPTSFDNMFVVARKLKQLCEFKGGRVRNVAILDSLIINSSFIDSLPVSVFFLRGQNSNLFPAEFFKSKATSQFSSKR